MFGQETYHWRSPDVGGFRAGTRNLQRRHLSRRGTYHKVRAILPIPALAAVWFFKYHNVFGTHRGILHATVTIEHLFEALAAALLWCAATQKVAPRLTPSASAVKAELQMLLRASALCGLLLFLLVGMRGYWAEGVRLGGILFGAFFVVATLSLCIAFCASVGWLPEPRVVRKAILIGSGPRAAHIHALATQAHGRLAIQGFLDEPDFAGAKLSMSGHLGTVDRLPELLKNEPIDLVLIGLPVRSQYERIQEVITLCEKVGVECHYPLDVFETSRTMAAPFSRSPLLTAHDQNPFDMRRLVKRVLDFGIAAFALVILSPLLLVIAVTVKLTSRGPVFFVQQRYGQNRVRFPMFKFRSMVVDAEKRMEQLEARNEAEGPVFKLRNDPRVTPVGALLRKTSLDELPQLINVLRGEMAIVGPRPLPVRDVSRFSEVWLLRRFSVRPGLTCLWQVRGRSNTMFNEWMQLDLEYIDNWSLSKDLAIMALTVPAVLKGNGAM